MVVILVGVVIMAAGFVGAYVTGYGFEWFALAFVGILITLLGMAFFSGGKKE